MDFVSLTGAGNTCFYDEDRKAQEMYTTFLFTGQL